MGKLAVATTLLSATLGVASGAEGSLNISNENQDYLGYDIYSKNGNGIDTLVNGVVYDQKITGDQDVVFSAPNAKYNPTRVNKNFDSGLVYLPEPSGGSDDYEVGRNYELSQKLVTENDVQFNGGWRLSVQVMMIAMVVKFS